MREKYVPEKGWKDAACYWVVSTRCSAKLLPIDCMAGGLPAKSQPRLRGAHGCGIPDSPHRLRGVHRHGRHKDKEVLTAARGNPETHRSDPLMRACARFSLRPLRWVISFVEFMVERQDSARFTRSSGRSRKKCKYFFVSLISPSLATFALQPDRILEPGLIL